MASASPSKITLPWSSRRMPGLARMSSYAAYFRASAFHGPTRGTRRWAYGLLAAGASSHGGQIWAFYRATEKRNVFDAVLPDMLAIDTLTL
jgi:hypothetical protein